MFFSYYFIENFDKKFIFDICISADKPDCTITRREINDEDTLVCTATGNPAKVYFIYICGKCDQNKKKNERNFGLLVR